MECPECLGRGWCVERDRHEMPVQVQCEYCLGHGNIDWCEKERNVVMTREERAHDLALKIMVNTERWISGDSDFTTNDARDLILAYAEEIRREERKRCDDMVSSYWPDECFMHKAIMSTKGAGG